MLSALNVWTANQNRADANVSWQVNSGDRILETTFVYVSWAHLGNATRLTDRRECLR